MLQRQTGTISDLNQAPAGLARAMEQAGFVAYLYDAILLKPGPLTDDEWEMMRRHPALAREMIAPIPFLSRALDIPSCHHERGDGTGYPQGLARDAIPTRAGREALRPRGGPAVPGSAGGGT